MSTDRDLLEAAARAFWAGEIDDVVSIEWGEMDACILYTHADNQDHNGRDRQYRWNPLEENHDALELLTKLRLSLIPIEGGAGSFIATTRSRALRRFSALTTIHAEPLSALLQPWHLLRRRKLNERF